MGRLIPRFLARALCLFVPALAGCGPSSARHATPDGGRAGTGTGGGGSAGAMGSGGSSVAPGAARTLDDSTPTGPYRYRSVSILGGGFVTGLVFSPAARELIFARTDIGGAYRWNGDHWMSITDWVDRNNGNWMGIESIACDPSNPDIVYLAAGTYLTAGNGAILRSSDGGITFNRYTIPIPMGANMDGRSMGERLAVDPNQPSTLYFASRSLGLWRSTDSSVSWGRVASFPATGALNLGLSWVLFDPRGVSRGQPSKTIYVGVADTAGSSLYRSTDSGENWTAIAGAPAGKMPHHGVMDAGGALYLAYNDAPGPNNVKLGGVFRFDPTDSSFTDVSPPTTAGIGGLSLDASQPGTLLATTIDLWPDEIYRTTDAGKTWNPLGPAAQRDSAGAQYLYFGGSNLSATGWMGDVEIDPFNPDRALYVTGQGVWWSDDLTAADRGEPTHWSFQNQGLEETVALDLAVPPSGAQLLSAVGDIGGFRHDELDRPAPSGMYENPVFGNTVSLDFAEGSPDFVVRAGTAGSRARRGAYSLDGGSSWTPFPVEPTASRGQGTITVSADGTSIVWAAQGAVPAYSTDRGQTWQDCAGLASGARVAADRVNPDLFYALQGSGAQLWVSQDRGVSFTETASGLARVAGRPRPVFGLEGDLWLPTEAGLLHSIDAGATLLPVPSVQLAYAVGFGKAAPDASYPAIYLSGKVDNQLGVYRSDDGGESWLRIDDLQHQYGYLNVVAGDPRNYGRVFLGTGGRGIVYGEPVP